MTNSTEIIEIWRRAIVDAEKTWVLFSHDTCLILMQPESDLSAQATAIMAEYGPGHMGSSGDDRRVLKLKGQLGWAVFGDHPDMLTYVSFVEAGYTASDLEVGRLARAKREQDARDLLIVHIEDKRERAVT
jgi:hypothetical protein